MEAAIGMSILFTIVLVCSSLLVSLLRKIISEEIRTPAYIVIIATFVTLVKMLTNAFLPELYSTLGVFISLIVVNCIVLGRAEAYASKNGPFDSFIDALGMGAGYAVALIIMAFFRELIGTGALSIGKVFTFIPELSLRIIPKGYEISLFQAPAGAFIVFAIILAVIAFVKNRKAELEFNKQKQVNTDKPINMVLINGIECEPYITADHRLMLEYPYRIMEGIKYVMQAFNCKKALICIKSKYHDIKKLYKEVIKEYQGSGIELCCVGNYYPQGYIPGSPDDSSEIANPVRVTNEMDVFSFFEYWSRIITHRENHF